MPPEHARWTRQYWRHKLALTLALLALGTWVGTAFADATSSSEISFETATAALQQGAFERAIAEFEQLSDQGVRDPAVSYNRGLAYLQRAESAKRRVGDLGQAAAALREATLGGVEEAPPLLQSVREEIARQRARARRDPVAAEAPLGWAIAKLLGENVWAWGALVSAVLLTVGLWLRRQRADSPLKLAGNIVTGVASGALLVLGVLTASAQHLRKTVHEAVVISAEAPLLDEQARPVRGAAVGAEASEVPEGASVYALETRGNLVHVRWGSAEVWLGSQHLRRIDGG